jgi:hypothetical protein
MSINFAEMHYFLAVLLPMKDRLLLMMRVVLHETKLGAGGDKS